MSRHNEATLRLCPELGQAAIDLAVGSGAPPGDSNSADAFGDLFYPRVEAWLERTPAFAVRARIPWTYRGSEHTWVDVGFTAYADDLARKVVFDSTAELHRALRVLDQSLDSELEREGYLQNHSKKEVVPRIVGEGRQGREQWVFGHAHFFGAKMRSHARYLGSQHHYCGSNKPEIRARLKAIDVAFYSFGRFWYVGPRKFAILVFRATVVGSALAGLTSNVLTAREVGVLETRVLKYGRRLLLGQACKKPEETGGKHKSIANLEVLKFLGIADLTTELRIRRLGMWQAIALDRDRCCQVLASIFGVLENERDKDPLLPTGCLSEHAGPWAEQLVEDVAGLSIVDDLACLPEAMDNRPLRLFEGDVRHLFLSLDISMLRRRTMCATIPPPGWAPPPVGGGGDSEGESEKEWW